VKNKTVLGIFFFLTLMTSAVFGYVSENSRQGFEAKINNPHPVSALGEPRLLLGFEVKFLNFRVGIGIITKDPIGFEGGLNLYNYVNNNPLAFTDPFGLKIELAAGSDPALYAAAESRLMQSSTGASVVGFLKGTPATVKIYLLPDSLSGGGLPIGGQTDLPADVVSGKRDYTSCDEIPLRIYLGSQASKLWPKYTWAKVAYIAVELGHEGGHVKSPQAPEMTVFTQYERAVFKELYKLNLIYK